MSIQTMLSLCGLLLLGALLGSVGFAVFGDPTTSGKLFAVAIVAFIGTIALSRAAARQQLEYDGVVEASVSAALEAERERLLAEVTEEVAAAAKTAPSVATTPSARKVRHGKKKPTPSA